MLVEDDNNLREIYGARLLAEGYEIVSAKDGEEALALAVKEKPDLIISDIMMPKISGFDMLDILRSTPETKNTKVIMMTALSQAEDKERATKLGADRYLVKSQVTLEDVAKAAAEVLGSDAAPATPTAEVQTPTVDPAPASVAPATTQEPATSPAAPAPTPSGTSTPVTPAAPAPVVAPAPVPETPAPTPTPITVSTPPEPAATSNPTPTPVVEPAKEPTDGVVSAPASAATPDPATIPVPTPTPVTPAAPAPINIPKPTSTSIPVSDGSSTAPANTMTSHSKVITPINDLNAQKPDLEKLLAAEEAKTATAPAPAPAPMMNDVTPPSMPTPVAEGQPAPAPITITPDGQISS